MAAPYRLAPRSFKFPADRQAAAARSLWKPIQFFREARRGAQTRLASLASLAVLAVCALSILDLFSVSGPLAAFAAPAQQSAGATQAPVLRVRRNEVLVRVIVRDFEGKALDGLKQTDFRLLDEKKPQTITYFEVVRAAGAALPAARPEPSRTVQGKGTQPRAVSPPERYVLLVFDNTHTPFDGLVRSREAAKNFLTTATSSTDRVGIVTTAGDIAVEFTDDRKKLDDALLRLRPSFHGGNPMQDCPRVTDYVADRAANYDDPEALQFIIAQAAGQGCPFQRPEQAAAFARQAEEVYRGQSANSLSLIKSMVRRLGSAPGERLLILVSSGFVAIQADDSLDQIIEPALRAGVVISGLDPEGLTNPSPLADASREVPVQPPRTPGGRAVTISNLPTLIEGMASTTQQADWDLLFDLAESTGGRFFHNNNDINLGLRELGGAPEVSYLLAFSPRDLKLDGKFHRLKVELANSKGLTVRARRGYFAPTRALSAAEEADKEIEDAASSRTEVRQIPAEIRTAFHKIDTDHAGLAVFIHVDTKALPFRKESGRNDNELTFVTVLFDRDGNYLDGRRSRMQLHLTDANLTKVRKDGVGIRADFQIAPGTYFIREVVRDSEGSELTALNQSVEIPR